MISNSWNKSEGESISQRMIGKVRPDEPLKNKIDFAQKKLQFQISKLEVIDEKLKKKHQHFILTSTAKILLSSVTTSGFKSHSDISL